MGRGSIQTQLLFTVPRSAALLSSELTAELFLPSCCSLTAHPENTL